MAYLDHKPELLGASLAITVSIALVSGRHVLDVLLGHLINTIMVVYCCVASFTKVEESFNMQAIHDILHHGVVSANFDHMTFSGPVPRTFAGAVALSASVRLFWGPLFSFLGIWNEWITVRVALGYVTCQALKNHYMAVRTTFGRNTAIWYFFLQFSQFHVIFYASRTLPNTYAFILTTIAYNYHIGALASTISQDTRRRYFTKSLILLTFAGVVFRSELALLVGTQAAYVLYAESNALRRIIIPAGLSGLALGLLVTIPIDTYFWQRGLIWPELSAFYYNTILGKSSEWGTSSWHFYFTSALPRLLLNPLAYTILPFVAIDVAPKESLSIVIPSLSFVALYSILPHKEARFIIYVIPPLTTVAAIGAGKIWARRRKSVRHYLVALLLPLSILLTFAASVALLIISSQNYPGGYAAAKLLNMTCHQNGTLQVYADNLTCQTGLTRFMERSDDCSVVLRYDKTENSTALLSPGFWDQFDYVLSETPERIIGKWPIVETAWGYDGISIGKCKTQQVRDGGGALRDHEKNLIEEMLHIDGNGPWVKRYNRIGELVKAMLGECIPLHIKLKPKIFIMRKAAIAMEERSLDSPQ